MKKLLTLSLIALTLIAVHAAEIAEDLYSAAHKLAVLPVEQRAVAQSIISKDIPDNLPDIIGLGVSWGEWKKARVADFFDTTLDQSFFGNDPVELQNQRQWFIDNTILLSYNDPFSKAFKARPGKNDNAQSHGWVVVKTFMNAKVADDMLNWILPDFENLYKTASRDQQITFRMAVRSALQYLQTVDFAAETSYLEKIQSVKSEERRSADFWQFNADGSDREFGHVKTFLYRRYADKTFTKEEMVTLVTKIDSAMSKWGPK